MGVFWSSVLLFVLVCGFWSITSLGPLQLVPIIDQAGVCVRPVSILTSQSVPHSYSASSRCVSPQRRAKAVPSLCPDHIWQVPAAGPLHSLFLACKAHYLMFRAPSTDHHREVSILPSIPHHLVLLYVSPKCPHHQFTLHLFACSLSSFPTIHWK